MKPQARYTCLWAYLTAWHSRVPKKVRRGSRRKAALRAAHQRTTKALLEQEGTLTALVLWMLDQNLELQPQDPRHLGILVATLQGEVEGSCHVPRLLVFQLEHFGIGGGARDVVLHTLLFLHTVGHIEAEEGDAGPQVWWDQELPRHELVFGKAFWVVG